MFYSISVINCYYFVHMSGYIRSTFFIHLSHGQVNCNKNVTFKYYARRVISINLSVSTVSIELSCSTLCMLIYSEFILFKISIARILSESFVSELLIICHNLFLIFSLSDIAVLTAWLINGTCNSFILFSCRKC